MDKLRDFSSKSGNILAYNLFGRVTRCFYGNDDYKKLFLFYINVRYGYENEKWNPKPGK